MFKNLIYLRFKFCRSFSITAKHQTPVTGRISQIFTLSFHSTPYSRPSSRTPGKRHNCIYVLTWDMPPVIDKEARIQNHTTAPSVKLCILDFYCFFFQYSISKGRGGRNNPQKVPPPMRQIIRIRPTRGWCMHMPKADVYLPRRWLAAPHLYICVYPSKYSCITKLTR